jgi:hypothetical protein
VIADGLINSGSSRTPRLRRQAETWPLVTKQRVGLVRVEYMVWISKEVTGANKGEKALICALAKCAEMACKIKRENINRSGDNISVRSRVK